MESMSNGEKKAIIITRLFSLAVIISVFAFATAIKKPLRGNTADDKTRNFLEIAFLNDLTKPAKNETDEVVAKEDNIEVPVTSTPEENIEESDEKETDDNTEKTEENVTSDTEYYSTAVYSANVSTSSNTTSTPTAKSSQSTKAPNPNYPSNYDAGSPYAGQIYVDGGEAPELNNPTYYEIPGGNPNVVVEPEEPDPVVLEDPETEK